MSENIKYDNHEKEWDKAINDKNYKKIALTWLRQDDSLNRWRHDRMYKLIEPLIKFDPNLSWLTVGNGRFGVDANAITKLGARNVMCTDMSDKLLKIGKKIV